MTRMNQIVLNMLSERTPGNIPLMWNAFVSYCKLYVDKVEIWANSNFTGPIFSNAKQLLSFCKTDTLPFILPLLVIIPGAALNLVREDILSLVAFLFTDVGDMAAASPSGSREVD